MAEGELAFIELLRGLARDPAARGLSDDAAVLEVGGTTLVLTADTLVEGVHFLSDDPPGDIGWKLAAVNLSDLAAKGARPIGCLMSYSLTGDAAWDAAFVAGLGEALDRYGMPLLGGDTVAAPKGSARSFSLTAIGETAGPAPARGGAKAGDQLFVTDPVGDAGAGLALLRAGKKAPEALIDAYRRPHPHVELGRRLAPHVHAMMDISDGLLIDARRMGEASGLAVHIDAVPLSPTLSDLRGMVTESRMEAATAGDDYVLLFAAPAPVPGIEAIRVGHLAEGSGLSLSLDGVPRPLPKRLGYLHD